MGFIDEIKARAKACKKTIVLPETEDERTYKAAETVLKEGEEQTYVYNSLLTAEQGTIATVDIFTDLDNDGIGEIIGPTEYNSVPFMIAPEHYLAIDDVTVFPDTAFQKYLHTIDWLNDGYMSDYEFNETTYINVNERNITTLKGLEFFKNLTRLDCLNLSLIHI